MVCCMLNWGISCWGGTRARTGGQCPQVQITGTSAKQARSGIDHTQQAKWRFAYSVLPPFATSTDTNSLDPCDNSGHRAVRLGVGVQHVMVV